MDPINLITLSTDAAAFLQPYLPVIAMKAAEKIGEGLPEAVGKLWSAIRAKFATRPAADESALDLLQSPDDPDLQAAFRVQLKKALESDAAFAEQIQKIISQTTISASTVDGAVAIGNHAKAVGKDGVLIEGNVQGDFIARGGQKTGG